MQNISPGSIWRHYKSKEGDIRHYEVIDIAHHSETDEEMVIYRPLYEVKKESCIYGYRCIARPISSWFEVVEKDGKNIQRFTQI